MSYMKTRDELLHDMEALIEAGDTQAVEQYVVEHFKDLPKEVQGEVLMQFFSEAVASEAGVAQIQERGLEALEALRAKREAVPAQGNE